jgi:hypothetical protein
MAICNTADSLRLARPMARSANRLYDNRKENEEEKKEITLDGTLSEMS